MEAYQRLELLLPPEREELLAAELWGLGTMGIEARSEPGGQVRLLAYFSSALPAAALDEDAWRAQGAELVAAGPFAAEDWLAAYRAQARPFPLGHRLFVDPGEPGAPPPPGPPGRRLLRLPARRAFGTGSHESTSLAVELLEREAVRGRTVLDLGSGSGILCFASLLFGARRALGLEVDLAAAVVGGENRRLNDCWPSLVAGELRALAARPTFDVVVANLLFEELEPLLGDLAQRLLAGGVGIFSGLLESRRAAFERLLRAAGFAATERRRRGEWVALRTELQRP